jgi:hypothetical protein
MTAVVTYRVVDARQAVTVSDGPTWSVYRKDAVPITAIDLCVSFFQELSKPHVESLLARSTTL